MIRRGWKLALAMAPVSTLLAVASHAAPLAGGTTKTVSPSIVELRDTWSRATATGPTSPTLVSFLETGITPVAPAAAPPSGGGIELDEPPPPEGGVVISRKILLVASIDASQERDMHHRTALLEQLLHGLHNYRDAQADLARSDEVTRLGPTA